MPIGAIRPAVSRAKYPTARRRAWLIDASCQGKRPPVRPSCPVGEYRLDFFAFAKPNCHDKIFGGVCGFKADAQAFKLAREASGLRESMSENARGGEL